MQWIINLLRSNRWSQLVDFLMLLAALDDTKMKVSRFRFSDLSPVQPMGSKLPLWRFARLVSNLLRASSFRSVAACASAGFVLLLSAVQSFAAPLSDRK